MTTRKLLVGLSLFALAQTGFANTIFFTVDNLGGNAWEYNYTLSHTGAAGDPTLEAFSIFFDLGLYENLSVSGSPADWDSIVFQPDPGLPDDGIFDSFALVVGIDPGEIVAGFSVIFDFLGVGAPGEQFFEFYDPFDFSVIADGITELQAVSVPEPASLSLFAAGLMIIAFGMRRRRVPLQRSQLVI